jgi:hypothetical protein
MSKGNNYTAAYPERNTTKKRLRMRLDDTGHILREMSRVYREMRAEIIDSQHGSRLVAALAIMRQTREFQLIEEDLLKMRHELNQLQNRDKPMLTVVKNEPR